MKTSHILFALAILAAILGILFQGTFGYIKMTPENQPTNTLSKLWLKMYDLKVTDSLSKPIKYIKVFGNGANTYLYLQKVDQPSLFSTYPQSYTYRLNGDTLLLYIQKSYANIHLNQTAPIREITVHSGSLNLTGFSQDSISLFATHNSRMNVGDKWQRKQSDSISRVNIGITEQSKVNLINVKMKTIASVVDNSILNYEANAQADSVNVLLKGKSTVVSNDRDAVNQIKNLMVSGERQYFKREFAGKGVHLISE